MVHNGLLTPASLLFSLFPPSHMLYDTHPRPQLSPLLLCSSRWLYMPIVSRGLFFCTPAFSNLCSYMILILVNPTCGDIGNYCRINVNALSLDQAHPSIRSL